MNRLSKNHLWEWFRRHHQEYLALKNKPKKEITYWLNELNAHLRAYFKFLGCSLEWKQEGTAILTITVNGKAMHFKKVETLVAKAPEIPGWTIVALEGPRSLDFLLEQQMIETGIDLREMYFSFSNDPHQIIVYHPLCTLENEHLFYKLANTAVYNLLGERSFGTDIGNVQVANLSSAGPGEVEELEILPYCISLLRSDVGVDNQGNLVGMD